MKFFVPLEKIVGKARPRFTVSGHVYTPRKTVATERAVRASFLAASQLQRAPQRPSPRGTLVNVKLTAVYNVPVSWPKNKRERALSGAMVPAVKPDIDNVVKLVLDALNGVAFEDDSQVASIFAEKVYESPASTTGLHVEISEVAA